MASDGLNMMNADFTEHLVPPLTRQHRRPQLPRERHHLPDRSPRGGELPAGHQGDGSDRRPHPGPMWACWDHPRSKFPGQCSATPSSMICKLEEAKNRLLPAKNRYNIRSMALFLALRWFLLYAAALAGAVAVSAHGYIGVLAVSAAMLGFMLFSMLLLHPRGALRDGLPPPEARILLHLRPLLLAARTLWKLLTGAPFGGTPVQVHVHADCWASKSASGSTMQGAAYRRRPS